MTEDTTYMDEFMDSLDNYVEMKTARSITNVSITLNHAYKASGMELNDIAEILNVTEERAWQVVSGEVELTIPMFSRYMIAMGMEPVMTFTPGRKVKNLYNVRTRTKKRRRT